MVTVTYSNGVSVPHDYKYELRCYENGKYIKSLYFHKYSGARAWMGGTWGEGISFRLHKISGDMAVSA